MAGKYQECF